MNDNQLYTYFYSVPDCNGFPVSRYRLLTREEFISITGIDPARK